jgi:integrase
MNYSPTEECSKVEYDRKQRNLRHYWERFSRDVIAWLITNYPWTETDKDDLGRALLTYESRGKYEISGLGFTKKTRVARYVVTGPAGSVFIPNEQSHRELLFSASFELFSIMENRSKPTISDALY